MATRASIRIVERNNKIDLYHHWDGYPEGVGADLVEYLGKINPKCDWRIREIANDLVKGEIKNIESGEEVPDMGYELSFGFHCDIEYAYLINCDTKQIECYHWGYGEDYHSLNEVFECAKVVEIPSNK